MATEAAQILEQVPTTPDVTKSGEGVSTEANPQPISKPDEKVSSRLDVLIRREQAAVARERAAREREAELDAKLAKYAEFESAKTNPDKALELLGLNYDELTRAKLNDGVLPPDVQIKKVEDKFEAYRKSQEEAEAKRTESYKLEQQRMAQEQEAKAISGFKSEIGTYLKDNSGRYEYTIFENQEDLVYDVVDEHYTRTLAAAQKLFDAGEITQEKIIGKVMSIAEAADKVEQWLEQKYNRSRELAKTKALWSQAIPKGTQQEIAKAGIKSSQPPKTLTNNLTATQTVPRTKPMTDEERVQRAVAYAKSLRG